MTADAFVEEILVGGCGSQASTRSSATTSTSARAAAARPPRSSTDSRNAGFGLQSSIRWSATAARRFHPPRSATALAAGDIAMANDLLGHRWFVVGEVVAGEQRGRELGFPTANIRLLRGLPPSPRHLCRHHAPRRGRSSTASRATAAGRPSTTGAPLLEVFAFDFSGDLYGEQVIVAYSMTGSGPRRSSPRWTPWLHAITGRGSVAGEHSPERAGKRRSTGRSPRPL